MAGERISRNDPCPCGSGKKYKNCCRPRDVEAQADRDLAPSGSLPGKRLPPPKHPLGTVAYYGPDDKRTTKIAAGVFTSPNAKVIIKRWVASDVMTSPKVQREIVEFFQLHGVKTVAYSEGNMGCPHEEGLDFPDGADCPFCPFWKGKQGSNRRD
jgi:hypothetical protein